MMFFFFDDIEEWRDIPGWEGKYQASSFGRIRSVGRYITDKMGRTAWRPSVIRKPHVTPTCHYYVIVLALPGHKSCNRLVHKLVCMAFHGLPSNLKMEVNHIDGNHHNNRSNNLEWSTRRENYNHSIITGLKHDSGWENSRAKLTRLQALLACELRNKNCSLKEIAKLFNVHPATIGYIVRHKTYKNLWK